MAARQHSRFVHFVLPWLIAGIGGVLFWMTLHRWVSFNSVGVISRISGWDWNTAYLSPITLLVTWPVRLLPASTQVAASNGLAALLAATTLGLLAKSVALLPHDRTREQRQRERSDFSFLTSPLAWIPPVAAAALLAFQLTFWEHATAMTGEMVTLTLFAFCVFCFLRFRVFQEDRYLAWLAFAFGAAATNDWGVIAFCPLFFVAIVWAKGVSFFDGRFLIRTTAAGLAGLLFYLVQPMALKITGQADGTFLELLRTQLGYQRQFLFGFPRWPLVFCSLTSVVPLAFIGIRWPSTFGDMSAAGATLTGFFFRLIQVAFLAIGAWTMFDPPFSPRAVGFGLPFLHFYYLTALVVGYASGYLLLVLGQEPERRLKRASTGLQALGRLAAGLVGVASLSVALALAIYNFRTIRIQNGTLTRELAETLLPPTGSNLALLSDDQALLMLAVGRMQEVVPPTDVIPIQTDILKYHFYQRHHEKTYGANWPALELETMSNPLSDNAQLQQIYVLSRMRQLFYLHPSFGYHFEALELVPTDTIYAMLPRPTNQVARPALSDAAFAAIDRAWTQVRQHWVDDPALLRMKELRVADAVPVAKHFARALNTWGVFLQRRGQLAEAATFFTAAADLDQENLAAVINRQSNETLQAGKHEAVVLDQSLSDRLGQYRDLPTFLSRCGPVDEPSFCFRLGRNFYDARLYRQAVEQFTRAYELQPNSIETRLWLTSAKLSAQRFTEVLHDIASIRSAAADSLTPAQQTDLVTMQAWATYRQGDLPAAEKIMKEAIQAFPDRQELLRSLNDIYVAANDTNAALAAVDQLIALNPGNARPLITKSAIQIQTGALAEAIETLNGVLEKEPAYFPALVNRALAYSRLGQLEEAEKDYLKLSEIAPKLSVVYFHLGEIDYQRGKPASARRHYQRFLESATPGSPDARRAQDRLDAIAAGKPFSG